MAGLTIDTWAIIGAGIAMMAVVVTIMLALNGATNARIDSLQETMREEHSAMRADHTAILEAVSQVAQRVSYIEGRLEFRHAENSESVVPP